MEKKMDSVLSKLESNVLKLYLEGRSYYEISKILDWELSGIGWKEFDLAWALILRPSQTFMKTKEERDTFLEGYSANCSFDEEQLVYCMVMIYQHFYAIGKTLNDNEYMEYIILEFERLTGERLT